jgi:hypothetical protein
MEAHVKVLGVLYILSGLFTAFAGLAIFGVIAGAGLISGEREAILATGIIGTVIGAILIALSLPSLVAGIGLLARRNWARVLAIVIGALHILAFPIGTAIGIYTLWALLNEEARPVFAST